MEGGCEEDREEVKGGGEGRKVEGGCEENGRRMTGGLGGGEGRGRMRRR